MDEEDEDGEGEEDEKAADHRKREIANRKWGWQISESIFCPHLLSVVLNADNHKRTDHCQRTRDCGDGYGLADDVEIDSEVAARGGDVDATLGGEFHFGIVVSLHDTKRRDSLRIREVTTAVEGWSGGENCGGSSEDVPGAAAMLDHHSLT